MAVDKEKIRELLKQIDTLFDILTLDLSEEARDWLKQKVMGEALGEIEKLILKARPPRLFLVGRTGTGKSSLINALCGREVAEVKDWEPTTRKATLYVIPFEKQFAEWEVYDSRGIGEGISKDAERQTLEEIEQIKPDVILHVADKETVRGGREFAFMGDVFAKMKVGDLVIPVVLVLNKVDSLGGLWPEEWPPEEHAIAGGKVKKFVETACKLDESKTGIRGVHLCTDPQPVDRNFIIRGYECLGKDSPYLAVIPVAAAVGGKSLKSWNIGTLQKYIGTQLPDNAKLDYYQALRRKELLKGIADTLIKRFALIAGGIGLSPIPFSDIIVLTPLQMLMIGVIAGLSCRQVSRDTIQEYITAVGANVGAAYGLRELARQLVKIVPIGGEVISGTMAAAGTWALGQSAKLYFFSDIRSQPEELTPPSDLISLSQ